VHGVACSGNTTRVNRTAEREDVLEHYRGQFCEARSLAHVGKGSRKRVFKSNDERTRGGETTAGNMGCPNDEVLL
jgi:hypothetical protein